ncbi:MAG: amidase, partial [Bryobacteraceae bacterium]
TRTVRDAAVTLNAIAGHDARDATSSRRPVPDYVPSTPASIRGVRVGMPENYYLEGLDPEVEAAVRAMFRTAEQLGAQVIPVRVPDIDALNAVAVVILAAEASAALEPYLARRDEIGDEVRLRFDQGRFIAATDYINAQRIRRLFVEEFAELWKRVDCLFTPTTPTPAPKIGENTIAIAGVETDARVATTRFMRAINALGSPALSMPCGFSRSGLPLSLQILGAPFDEQRLLSIGAALEDATDFHKRRP